MILTSLPYRIAVLNALMGNVSYQGKKVGIYEDYVAETANNKKAMLTVGTGQVEAYIILLNQTSNESLSNKCSRNNNDTIQIQINTVWPAGKGGSRIAEEIANVVLGVLFPTSIKNTDLVLYGGLDMWKSELMSTRNINYDGSSSRTWVVQLVLESMISQ